MYWKKKQNKDNNSNMTQQIYTKKKYQQIDLIMLNTFTQSEFGSNLGLTSYMGKTAIYVLFLVTVAIFFNGSWIPKSVPGSMHILFGSNWSSSARDEFWKIVKDEDNGRQMMAIGPKESFVNEHSSNRIFSIQHFLIYHTIFTEICTGVKMKFIYPNTKICQYF